MFTVCENCLEGGYEECPLYICQSEDGFTIICCIVFAINHNLGIVQLVGTYNSFNEEDEEV